MKKLISTISLSIVINLSISFSQPGSLDLIFNSTNYFNNDIFGIIDMQYQSDGKIITLLYSNTSLTVKRFFQDGEIDPSFYFTTPIQNDESWDLEVLNDDKILVLSNYKLLKLNANGTIDNTFTQINNDSFSGQYFQDIQVLANNQILLSGGFDNINGTQISSLGLVKLNSDGSLDLAFNAGGAGINTIVDTYIYRNKEQPDGKIILTGNFISYNGINCGGIVRINPDGTVDNTFDVGVGFDISIERTDIKFTNDNKILIVGTFNNLNNEVNSSKIIKLNLDGSRDVSFNSPFISSNNLSLLSIEILDDETIIVAGYSNFFNQIAGFYKLLPNGNIDNSFDIGSGFYNTDNPTFTYFVSNILIQGNKAIVCGNFSEYNDVSKFSFARINLKNFDAGFEDKILQINKLYPNPSKQETTLSFSTYQNQVSYSLLSLSGQVLHEKSNLCGKELKVNLSDVPNGMYFIEAKTDLGTEIVKVVKE